MITEKPLEQLHASIRFQHLRFERAKRLIDLLISITAIVLLSPLFLLLFALIKCSQFKHPAVYRQIRIGKDGKPFRMLKFRTMQVGAEHLLAALLKDNEIEGKMFKVRNDPRITTIGKWLRQTSLDELPQLFNVIAGDMSLVGPRPSLPDEVAQYDEYEKQRLAITPGCTGLWQVSGRNLLSFSEMIDLDLYYIRHRSLGMDLSILLRTIPAVISRKGAY